MNITKTDIPGLLVIEPTVFKDERGFFVETYNEEPYGVVGISQVFVQDNCSWSCRGSLRGLHFQEPEPQGKLVQVLYGSVFDVAVDLRRGSPTFGKWVSVGLSDHHFKQLWIPPGFAHGFCVTSENALFAYKCTVPYAPDCDRAIAWNDPDLGITWPIQDPLLSPKDANAPNLKDAAVLPMVEFE